MSKQLAKGYYPVEQWQGLAGPGLEPRPLGPLCQPSLSLKAMSIKTCTTTLGITRALVRCRGHMHTDVTVDYVKRKEMNSTR